VGLEAGVVVGREDDLGLEVADGPCGAFWLGFPGLCPFCLVFARIPDARLGRFARPVEQVRGLAREAALLGMDIRLGRLQPRMTSDGLDDVDAGAEPGEAGQ